MMTEASFLGELPVQWFMDCLRCRQSKATKCISIWISCTFLTIVMVKWVMRRKRGNDLFMHCSTVVAAPQGFRTGGVFGLWERAKTNQIKKVLRVSACQAGIPEGCVEVLPCLGSLLDTCFWVNKKHGGKKRGPSIMQKVRSTLTVLLKSKLAAAQIHKRNSVFWI